MHIHNCSITPEYYRDLKLRLRQLDKYVSSQYTAPQTKVVIQLAIDDPIMRLSGATIENVETVKICILCKKKRYILYSGSDSTIPSFVFMWSLHQQKHGEKKNNHLNKVLQVFSFTGDVGVVGGGGVSLIQSLHNPSAINAHIIRDMAPFIWRPAATVSNGAIRTNIRVQRDDLVSVVGVRDKSGHVSDLNVYTVGVETVDAMTKCIGGMGDCPRNARALLQHRATIARNETYTLDALFWKGTFFLSLYQTHDILTCSDSSIETLVPLVTLSHDFHFMGSIVEQRRYNPSGDDGTITGMLKVVHAILRREIPAAPIRFMVGTRDVQVYRDMQAVDVTQILRAMRLVSDDRAVVKFINARHSGSIVATLVKSDKLIPPKYLPGTARNSDKCCGSAEPCSDFVLHHSGTLRYAVAHTNKHIMTRLKRSPGLNVPEVCTLLHSGIAFCCSYAYGMAPTEIYHGVGVHLINRSDFPSDCEDLVDAAITAAVDVMQSETVVLWVQVSHNFCVQAAVDTKNHKIELECHIAETGLVFFRRKGHVVTTGGSCTASVYIPPGIIRTLPGLVDLAIEPPVIPTPTPAVIPLHPIPVYVHDEHPLVQVATKFGSENLLNKQSLLRNATETLFMINAICVHNKTLLDKSGSSVKYHKMLRTVWFHTYVHRAVQLCGGMQNIQFYTIYAHIGNLAALPLNNVGEWAQVPYV